MGKLSPDGSPVAGRLREARKNAGLSQKKLGELAGVDQNSASARLNQYETGKHSPDFGMLQRLSDVLNVPVEYFYTTDETVAKLLIKLHSMDESQKEEVFKNCLKKTILS
jgi:transcriptional regulator with XRE-family HTH domain